MKAFISLSIALILITLDRDNHVNGECFELVQQYYECKHLDMIDPNDGSFPTQTYIPNSWVPNNVLNDAFYANLNLDQMTFDGAMDLFWDIYNSTKKDCEDDEFCKCVSTGIIDQNKYGKENSFSIFFRNLTNFEQVKIILHEFINKFDANRLPYSALEGFFKSKTHSNQVLPTLAEFCMKYDYTDERYIYYNDSFNCFTDDITVHDCKFDVLVDKVNKNVTWHLTNPVMEKLMTCNLANALNCAVETQKFHLLTSWPQEYPQFSWQGESMSAYYDTLISDAHSIDPELKFIQSDLYTMNDTLFVTNLNIQSSYQINGTTELRAILLNSPHIIIEGTWSKKSFDPSDNTFYMSLANFTFIAPDGRSYAIITLPTRNLIKQQDFFADEPATFNINLSSDEYNYNTYEIYAMNLVDIYMHAFFNRTHFRLYLPDNQWVQSSSVFVNGFDGFEPITTAQSTTVTPTTMSTTSSTSTLKPTTSSDFNSASRINNVSSLSLFIILSIAFILCVF